MKDTRKLTYTGLLMAIAGLIPFVVIFKINVYPFTATLGAHVPMFISMFLGPQAAILVGIGSALGFTASVSPLVGARALMHSVVGAIGAVLVKRGWSLTAVAIVTAPIHGLLEMLVILPFVTFNARTIFILTGIGTVLHHFVDAGISYVLAKVLLRSKNYEFI